MQGYFLKPELFISNNPMIRFLTSIMIFMFFGAMQCFAQINHTSTQLLANELETDADLQLLLQNNLQFLKESKQGMPLIDKMEFRTESDRLDIERQELLFRISFNKGRSRKVQDQITINNINLYETRTRQLDEAELSKRYERIVDWHYGQLELERLKEKKVLLEDKKTVYQKMLVNALVVDIDDLLKVEENILKVDRNISKLEYLKAYSIEQLLPDRDTLADYELDPNLWVSIETMKKVLDENKEVPTYNLDYAQQSAKVNFSQLKYDMGKSEANKILDFVQVKYAQRGNIDFYQELSLGLAFNIPVKSTSRVKMNKNMLELFDEQYEQHLLELEIEEKIAIYYTGFDLLNKEYQLVQQQIADNRLEATFEKYSAAEGAHPLTLLRIKESILDNKRLLKEIEKDACLLFLEILRLKGLIHQVPTTNYLSDDLHSF